LTKSCRTSAGASQSAPLSPCYQFSPRIAGFGDARLWPFDRDANYDRFDGVARNCINPEVIA
jgi:hypothetical protein